MEAQAYASKTLDHLGLVDGMCQEIGISKLVDTYCFSGSPDIHYTVQARLEVDQKAWENQVFKRSLFLLATNQTVETIEQEAELLQVYKQQQSVEKSFRFIKNPNIVALLTRLQRFGIPHSAKS